MNRQKRSKSPRSGPKQRGFFIFIGLFLTIVAAGILWFTARVNTFDCRRVESSQIECTIQIRWLGLLPLKEQAIHQLQAASVNRNCSRDINDPNSNETCTYSVDLMAAEGAISLSGFIASGGNEEQKHAFVEQVNAFVHSPETPSFQASQTELGPQTVVMGLLFLTGLSVVIVQAGRAVSEMGRVN